MEPSIFLDFTLPKAATWFYFSLILSVTLFFQFTRILSVRNLDLLTLFLLVPGFLLLQEANALEHESRAADARGEQDRVVAAREVAAVLGAFAGSNGVVGVATAGASHKAVDAVDAADAASAALAARARREKVFAYAWLMAGSVYWFARALVDLALVRRPVMSPNLNTTGLGWLGLALVFCLTAVAARRTADAEVVAGGGGPVAAEPDSPEFARRPAPGAGQPPTDVRFWLRRSMAGACHLAVVAGLLLIGLRHFQDLTTGMALGTLYLLVPYTAFDIGRFDLVWPAAFVTWAVFCYRRPVVSGWLLGLTGGSSFVPLLLFPLWFGFYAGRGSGRFAASFVTAAGLSFGTMALVVSKDGGVLADYLAANWSDWLPWRRSAAEGMWTGVRGAYRLPISLLYVAFLAVVAVWPSPKNLSHLVSLSAAVLIGVQFWHGDRGGVYVLWYLPLILLISFRPTLTAHHPPVAEPGDGRMLRWAGAAWRRVRPSRAGNTSTELAV